MTKRQNNLGTYLAVTAGVGCASSVANAAVTFYGVNSANDTKPDPTGIMFGQIKDSRGIDSGEASASYFVGTSGVTFTRGSDIMPGSPSRTAIYSNSFGGNLNAEYGASLNTSENYANISFNGNDGVFEAVGQFYFDGMGGGYLIAIATTNAVPDPQDLSAVGGPALSISAGKAMIDAAPVPVPSVPEPSSVALLALGATGLIARRRRKAA